MDRKLLGFCGFNEFYVKGNTAYGLYDGYEMNVFEAKNQKMPVRLHVSCHLPSDKTSAVVNELTLMQGKRGTVSLTPYGVSLGFSGFTLGKAIDDFMEKLPLVVRILNDNSAFGDGYCPISGERFEQNVVPHNIDGMLITLNESSVKTINEIIEKENAEYASRPNNYGKGFIGALIGGLVGAVLGVLLGMVGFISALSAFVGFFLGVKLYTTFGGKANKGMVWIVTAVTFACMIVSVFLTYYLTIAVEIEELELDLNAWEVFKQLITTDADVISGFIKDIGLTIVFTLLGTVSEIKKLKQNVKRPTVI